MKKIRLIKMISILFFLNILATYQTQAAENIPFVAKMVETGDFLVTILRHHGFETSDREEILRADPVLAQLPMALGSVYLASQTPSETILRFYNQTRSLSWTIIKEKFDGKVTVKRDNPLLQVEKESFEGKIKKSLFQAINNETGSNWVASRFLDAFKTQMNVDKLPTGSEFQMVVEKIYDGPIFIGFGDVLEALLSTSGERLKKILFRDSANKGGVFVSEQDLSSTKAFYSPVNYVRISSPYQLRRFHPIKRKRQPHHGVDFELEAGAPIFSALQGVVARAGSQRAAGNFVVIQHENGYETFYNHMSRLAPEIQEGTTVFAGQQVGMAGCTGYCTKPHLHFGIKKNDRWIDPLPLIRSYPAAMEKQILASYGIKAKAL